ncbi:hypothetical protein WJX81_007445 [Elliptochloris bilobata]|uniref:Fatty acid hydroxylase domain-containing protein n=1 Tax=Elliptochloris bilobata TaxID=381761 RepID=A0AAW1R0H7_9CHLO
MLPLYGGGFTTAALQVAAVYYGVAFLLHCLVPLAVPVKSIQVQPRQPGQASREALYSLGPLAVKAAVLRVVELLGAWGVSRLYEGPLDTAAKVLYVVATVAALDVLHDAWFYWTHRLLHWRPLYRHVHYIHHRSVAPTAFAGYSFHVAEAALVFANEILVCFLFSIHAGVHRAYHLTTTAIHIGGHAGYEIAPFIPSGNREPPCVGSTSYPSPDPHSGGPGGGHIGLELPCAALNTVQHHDMHHRFPTRHFSLYFTHWDRWCGTEHPAYRAQVAEHFQALADARKAASHCGAPSAARPA